MRLLILPGDCESIKISTPFQRVPLQFINALEVFEIGRCFSQDASAAKKCAKILLQNFGNIKL